MSSPINFFYVEVVVPYELINALAEITEGDFVYLNGREVWKGDINDYVVRIGVITAEDREKILDILNKVPLKVRVIADDPEDDAELRYHT